jgi:hypothetical protein
MRGLLIPPKMKNLKITYTDPNGIFVALTRDEETDIMSGEPHSLVTDDLAAITLRLLRDANVPPADFYDTLRETLQYEVIGFDDHLADLAKRYAAENPEPPVPKPNGKWATEHLKHNNAPAVYPSGANRF